MNSNIKRIFQISCLVILTVLTATSFAIADNAINQPYTDDKPNIMLSSKDSQFTIKLKSNPTTGYAWFLRNYDMNLLTPIKHKFIAPDRKLIGAPGYELWTFRVKPAAFVVPQQMTIRFIYARPWQGADNSRQILFLITTQ